MTARIEITSEGIVLSGERLLPAYDLLVEGRRVWSFRPDAAGEERHAEDGTPECWVPWPRGFERHLEGAGEFEVRAHGGETCARAELTFGEHEGAVPRIGFVNHRGEPLVLDSKGRWGRPFDQDEAGLEGLLDATETVLGVLRQAGIEAFLAYGTLLGAVREGAFIGHDNDVDLGYVSDRTSPVDVVRESLQVQRALARAGMAVERYSGAGIQVHVPDGQGGSRGLDVFGGYWHEDRLALLGEIHTPFRREWISPLTEVELVGRRFPAPAEPERLLEAMYGPGWRVPDPTFVFDSSAARDYLSRWYRGIREGRNRWNALFSAAARKPPPIYPRALARELHRREPAGSTVIDIGCGRGQDAASLAELGHPTIALDYSVRGAAMSVERARQEGWPMRLEAFNLLELRQVLGWGARLAREIEGPRSMLARHVVGSVSARGQEGLFRLASMVLRGGGRLYLEFFAAGDEPRSTVDHLLREVDLDAVRTDLAAYGGEVVEVTWPEDTPRADLPLETKDWRPPPRVCQMVVRWA